MTNEQITTAEQLDALPTTAVVIDADGEPWTLDGDGHWWCVGLRATTGTLVKWAPLRLVHPAPEPGHSMCSRLVGSDEEGWPWRLEHPNGTRIAHYSDADARSLGYAIPDAAPTVVEQAAKVLSGYGTPPKVLGEMAQALADAGLLREDGA